jgi:hypothetical protein
MKKLFSSSVIVMVIFSMMASSVFAGSSRKSIFYDLSLSSQFYEPMYSMYLKEIFDVEHKNDTNLSHPEKNVTRGDAAYMLYHLLGLTYVNGKDFSDVPKSNDYYDEIETTLAASGVIDGFTDGTFRPNDSLTRGQMAKIIASAFEYQIQANPSIPYTDVTKGFKSYVHAISKQGVTKGVTATKFAPNRFITRQEMAAFMYRAYKKVPGSAYNEFEVMNVLNEANRKVRIVTTQGLEKHFPNLQSSDISDDMKAITVEPYLSKSLKNYTGIPCYACDVDINLQDIDFGLPFTIKQVSNTSIIVNAIAHQSYFYSGYRGTIELVRMGAEWKTKSFTKISLEEEPLNLSIEQATDYLTYAIPEYWDNEVKSIKYSGKDPVTGDALFLVNGKTTYTINLDNGLTDIK